LDTRPQYSKSMRSAFLMITQEISYKFGYLLAYL
jgi:hypothetical protein